MKRRSDDPDSWEVLRAKIIGLGEQSIQKSYYPELQRRLQDFKRFRVLLDHSIDGIVLAQVPTGALTDVNESICGQLGYSREELLRMSFMDLVLPHESPLVSEILSRQSVSEQGVPIEASLKKRNGEALPVEMTIRLVDLGGSVYAVAVMRDITEHKKAEEERLAHLRFFESMDRVNRAILETNDLKQMMTNVLDVVLSVFNCDRAFLLYPCDPEAPSWQVPMECAKSEYPGILDRKIEMAMDAQVSEMLRILLRSNGPVKFGPGTIYPLRTEISKRFNIQSFMSMALYPKIDKPWQFGIHQCSYPRVWKPEEEKLFQEIGRRLADALSTLLTYRDLRKGEEFLNSIVENIPDMIFVKDAETLKFVRFNKAGEQLLGYSREELLGRNDYDFFPKKEADFFTTKDREVLSCKTLVDIPEERILDRSRNELILHTKKIPILDELGRPQYLLGISEDITKRRLAEEIIHQSEEKFRTLFMSMRDGFYLSEVIYDDDGDPCDYRYLEVNPEFEQMMGISRDQIIGKTYKELVPVDTTQWLDNYRKVARTGEPCTYEFYSDEYRMHFETYSYQPAKGQVCVIVRDITERKAMEEERRRLESSLFQSQKIESLGTLAGGIAHDFNNILTALMGYATLLQMKMDEGDPLLMYVDEIVSGSQKAAEMTRSLLAFSRQQAANFCPLGINDVIRGTEKLLKRLVTEDVTIRTTLAPDQPVIMADATQMDQILLNLATNARDAMPKGGILTIETEVVALDDQFRRVHGYGKAGNYVRISISDTGMGMDEATKERIFDPFFTTKEVGKGTGLGLSTVYGIVKQHDGFITVYSEPNRGSTFRIYFPAISRAVEKEQAVITPIKGGSEVILIAEDDEAVLKFTRDILTQYGYSIVEAVDGADAVEKFQRAGNIDLVILDSIMPKKNGREAYDEIRGTDPRVKVLFTSGYTRDIILDKGIEDGEFDFVSKPIQPITLLNKVREMLDR